MSSPSSHSISLAHALGNRSLSSSLRSCLSFFTDLYFLLQAADFLHVDSSPRGTSSPVSSAETGQSFKFCYMLAMRPMGLLDIPDF